MKVLLATFCLDRLTGSEVFSRDLAMSLRSRGHEVWTYAMLTGEVARELITAGIPVTDRLSDYDHVVFDVAHVHHNVVALAVRLMFPLLPIVLMVHGVVPELEQPPSADLGIGHILCVSEEVRDHVVGFGTFGAAATVERNFLDMVQWRPHNPPGRALHNVLVLANNYPEQMREIVEGACRSLGVSVDHVGLPKRPLRDVRPAIERADLVISLGRGILQALCMGRNAVVMGSEVADGFVDEETFEEFRYRNFSGRTRKHPLSAEALVRDLRKYDAALGGRLRAMVVRDHAEDQALTRLESHYCAVAERGVPTHGAFPLRPSRELMFVESQIAYALQARDQLESIYSSRSWRWATRLSRIAHAPADLAIRMRLGRPS